MKGEKKADDYVYVSRANGKSAYRIDCPFCHIENELQAWSKYKGVKCSKCGCLIVAKVGRGFYGKSEVKK